MRDSTVAGLLLGVVAFHVSAAVRLQWHEPLERGVKVGGRARGRRRAGKWAPLLAAPKIPPHELATIGAEAERDALAQAGMSARASQGARWLCARVRKAAAHHGDLDFASSGCALSGLAVYCGGRAIASAREFAVAPSRPAGPTCAGKNYSEPFGRCAL